MARDVVISRSNVQLRTKVKTGCATCRIRKIKCDEKKPSCQRCVNTGRRCDGYESLFRLSTRKTVDKVQTDSMRSHVDVQSFQPMPIEATAEEIDLLSRCFSTKTIFNVKLGCEEEAKQVLEASLIDPPVRYAISSLRALRDDFESSVDDSATATYQLLTYNYGLQQYNKALQGLTSQLAVSGSNGLRSVLLCCQIFISIEQVQSNFVAMAQHMIRGLRITREFRSRPILTATNELLPAYHKPLPHLDAFIIKLFAAPCRFADSSTTADASNTTSHTDSASSHPPPIEIHNLRTIAPNMRTDLTRIAFSMLSFLEDVSAARTTKDAARLLSIKKGLVESLESWLVQLDTLQLETGSDGPEPISISFMRLFHISLKVVLLGTLDSSSDSDLKLTTESNRLQDVAEIVHDRLRAYKEIGNGSGSQLRAA